MKTENLEVKRIVGKLLDSNTFVVIKGGECVIIDAGAQVDDVAVAVGKNKVRAVLLTHGHYDHSFYAKDYAKAFGCDIYTSIASREYLANAEYNYSEGKFQIDDFSGFQFLSGNGKLNLGEIEVNYFSLGGHSKGDMAFKIGDDIFVGDILIEREIGKIDLYGGDKAKMKESLMFLLNEDFKTIHSGHGNDNSKANQIKVLNLWIKFLGR